MMQPVGFDVAVVIADVVCLVVVVVVVAPVYHPACVVVSNRLAVVFGLQFAVMFMCLLAAGLSRYGLVMGL
jgi:hypothetical protein